ncbi:gliding motility-associated C-terminal domain-containing protein [Maribacter sp. 2210JD10-5]|uniref:gliding motility-associated C-terminal domain-containing protein n=1 Tax=Maribacter sp. 2210JD10-5 TaxID=3386272 RepID=UPI0039BC4904
MEIRHYFISIFLMAYPIKNCAQTIRNFGDAQMHEGARLGFYSAVANDGFFENSVGLAGFYGNRGFTFSGTEIPLFRDIEIANEEQIQLNIPLRVTNNINFVFGDFGTSKIEDTGFLELYPSAFYTGSSNFSKVNGFVRTHVSDNFLFPVGDEEFLRPLSIKSNVRDAFSKCVYLFENALTEYPFEPDQIEELSRISTTEFWKLESGIPAQVTLSWNERSRLTELSNALAPIVVVGYDKFLKKWVNLKSTDVTGTLNEGFVTSETFIPNMYTRITLGALKGQNTSVPKGEHYIVTPNGDGINDFLYFPELEGFQNNHVQLYDRNGLKVFEKENYTDEFTGFSSPNIAALNRDTGLPNGIYYYIISLDDGKFTLQGFIFLDR